MSESAGLRVLIVEDQALLAMELELVLEEAGLNVMGCAMDRAGALEVADREPLDLALVDINLLDGMTGPDIARRLIEDFGAAVIFLTANPEQIPHDFAGAIGALSKPFDEATLRAVMEFAGGYIRNETLGEAPRRFRLAPRLAGLA